MDIEKEYERIITIFSKAKRYYLSHEAEDDLLIATNHKCKQFYSVSKEGTRKYVSKSDTKTLAQLGKKAYAKKLFQNLPIEIKKLEHLLKYYNTDVAQKVYDSFPKEIQQIIIPFELTDKDYAEKWASESYETKGIKAGERFYTTENGEKVRSKSELTIANKLYIKGIKYRYEQAHCIKGFGTIYPDFTVLNEQTRKEIIWEHFGLMDNPEYVQNCLKKLETYASSGIFPGHGLIVTFESNTTPLNTRTLETIIESSLLGGKKNNQVSFYIPFS